MKLRGKTVSNNASTSYLPRNPKIPQKEFFRGEKGWRKVWMGCEGRKAAAAKMGWA
jgi:hypothetical protein